MGKPTYDELAGEVLRLTLENGKLRKFQPSAPTAMNCFGCAKLTRDKSGVFYRCKLLGVISPNDDYCTRKAAIQ